MYESWLKDHITAQVGGFAGNPTFEVALAELKNGKKCSHWIWYIFPQWVGLGASQSVLKFGVPSLAAGVEYLRNDFLRGNYLAAVEAVNIHLASGVPVTEIFDAPDDRKFVSSLTLMEHVSDLLPFSDDLSRQIRAAVTFARRDGLSLCQTTLEWIGNVDNI